MALATFAAAGPQPATAQSSPVTRPASDSIRISGMVTDSATGRPMQGGKVRIAQGSTVFATVTTDAQGRFAVGNLPRGSYTVEVRYIGYRAVTRVVDAAGGVPSGALAFQLAPSV